MLSKSFLHSRGRQQSQEYISQVFYEEELLMQYCCFHLLLLSKAAATESKRPAIKQRPTSLPIQDLLLNRVGYNMSKPSTRPKETCPLLLYYRLGFQGLSFLGKETVSWSVKLISFQVGTIEEALKKEVGKEDRTSSSERRKKVIVLSEGIRQRRRNPQGLFVESTIQTVCVRK